VGAAEGSSLTKQGHTTFVCGVKATLAEPKPEEPGHGFLEVAVDLPPMCAAKYSDHNKAGTDEGAVLTQRVNHIIQSSECFDLKQLCIVEGRKVWSLLVEAICLDLDGNLLDPCLASVLAALDSASVPEVRLSDEDTDMVIFEEKKRPLQLKDFPVSTTFAVFDENSLLMDPTLEEESLSEGLLSIVVNESDGSLVLVSKDGGHGVDEEQLDSCLKTAAERSKQVKTVIRGKINCSKSK
jgi:exosome complex component RRP43